MPVVSSAEEFKKNQFDYVIVGGGLAGLVLAVRLTEDPNITAGVLESGPEPTDGDPIIDVPAMMGRAVGDPKYDWMTFSTPQPDLNDREILISRARGIGGGSLINYMYMIRPNKDEFDRIEELGTKGWNWDSILHYMKKSEQLIPTDLSPEDQQKYAINTNHAVHGTTGPVQKTLGVVFSDFHADIVASATHFGVAKNLDANAGELGGISTGFASIDPKTAKRSSAYSAYYVPNAARKNLIILSAATVNKCKVIISDDSASDLKRVTGVEFVHDGAATTVPVKREVILSAGSLGTPRVLELSGIGNPTLLSRLGITKHVDLPGVGENLQDHVMSFAIAETENYETLDMLADPEVLKEHQALYAQKKGLLAAVPAPAYVYVPASKMGDESEVSKWHGQLREPEKLIHPDTPESVKKGIKKQFELMEKVWKEGRTVHGELASVAGHLPTPLHPPELGHRYSTVVSFLAQPLSRGYIHITSADPTAKVEVNPRYLSVESDFEMLVGLLKLGTKLYSYPPLANNVKGLVFPSLPEDESKRDQVLREYVRSACLSGIHPLGSAALMPRELGGVVDENLKVYGTSNLRVVDLSILPIMLATHPQTTVYAIAEKAADIIMEANL
ncbi:hypothetical protein V5O48_008981 [Marasmius crinis-equi]|uniref:Glucose-methanol-choline oxidoreductase N-terminal domain-containing protein n=1 Tax=Marasmius crinis-equi TaxID=585013 RepID=A0ABR3FCI6_9AGAR